ncbi:DUF427 domain-containing protein [Conexibacter sp. SYSU D00693]|uniref:DUF427 domain-containing protein n=1 Tax=Conexibacter sp. SYSU D00693 TaxID=2812560 RepID=UPI00196A382D|nr:DUF427 domain-containing protein [Conexibacter sp. SYSU D00693]
MAAAPPFDIEVPPERVEPTPRWVRVRAGDRWVADSRSALLHVRYGPGVLPTYCFAPEDVDLEAVAALPPGAARRLSVADGAPAELDGHWTFTWDGTVRWFEEAEEVVVHARDPRHRVDVVPSERHVVVAHEGEVLADSRRPHALFETTLPTRWYLPPQDVRLDLLEPSTTVSRCPFKGTARFLRHGGRDLAWVYDEPIPECPKVAGLVCFFDEHVDLAIDGERQRRPVTPWTSDPTG